MQEENWSTRRKTCRSKLGLETGTGNQMDGHTSPGPGVKPVLSGPQRRGRDYPPPKKTLRHGLHRDLNVWNCTCTSFHMLHYLSVTENDIEDVLVLTQQHMLCLLRTIKQQMKTRYLIYHLLLSLWHCAFHPITQNYHGNFGIYKPPKNYVGKGATQGRQNLMEYANRWVGKLRNL